MALGPDHPETLVSRNNLSVALGNVGRHDEALALHEDTLARREQILGPDHPDALVSRSNLAAADRGLGRRRASRARLEKTRDPHPPDTLGSFRRMTRNLRRLRRQTEPAGRCDDEAPEWPQGDDAGRDAGSE